mmetsp:Transcript_1283/g.2024  ORF Transcript_1283/g.2024 Transcript_1283/m.2024 type:complete len:354 (+) Transcript_1283:224-1285(+)
MLCGWKNLIGDVPRRSMRSARFMSTRIVGSTASEIENGIKICVKTTDGEFSANAYHSHVKDGIRAVNEEISPAISGLDPTDQMGIDQLLCILDGTSDCSKFGTGAVLGVSMAVARAGASVMNRKLVEYLADIGGHSSLKLPLPMLRTSSGVWCIPFGSSTFSDSIAMLSRVSNNCPEKGAGQTTEQQIDTMQNVIQKLDLTGEVAFGISQPDQELCNKYPIALIYDPYPGQDDVTTFQALYDALHENVQIVAGKELSSSMESIMYAVGNEMVNGVSIDLYSMGTVTQTMESVRFARGAGCEVIYTDLCGNTKLECMDPCFTSSFVVSQSLPCIMLDSLEAGYVGELLKIESAI